MRGRGQVIVFGQDANQISHAFRHTDVLGLDRAEVADAITRNLQPYLPLPVPPPRNFIFMGRVTVRGIELSYQAYPLSEELVNVGRITGP
jgi:hypothetical protein